MVFPMMDLKDVLKFVPLMEKEGVSKIARSPKGFLTAYKNGKLNEEWMKKRNAFLARTLPAYNKNPTYRRFLSIICWAYMPVSSTLATPVSSSGAREIM